MKKRLTNKFTSIIFLVVTLVISGQVTAKEVSQAELQKHLKDTKNFVLLDVRTEDEFAQGHIPNAVNISHTTLQSKLNDLSDAKDKQVIIYCRSGRRAEVARQILEANGFTHLDHLTGDFNAWSSNKLPIASSTKK